MKDNGTKVLSATEYIPDTPEAIIFESMLEGMAEYYSAELAQKVKRGMRETREKGNSQGGYLIYGYKIENKKYLIDEDKAEIVRYIFKAYSQGVFVKDIIKTLTDKGILNRNKPFATNTIHKMLRNEKYTGIYRYKDQVFTNMYPRIVPQEIFDLVKEKIAKNKYGSRSIDVVYLLRNKLVCGYCGSTITAETGTSHTGEVNHYYKCFGKKKHNGCTKTNVKKEILEDLIQQVINNVLTSKTNIQTLVNAILTQQEIDSKQNSTLNILLKELKETEKARKNILYAIEQGVINKSTNKRLIELEELQEQLDRKILIEKSKNIKKLTAEEIENFYIESLTLEPKILIEYLIKEIVLYDDKIEIKFNRPTKPKSPDDKNQGFSFYSKTDKLFFKTKTKYHLQYKNIEINVLI